MRKLSMITLGVSNMEQSIRFYKEVLELKREPYESDDIAFFDLDGPRLALFPKAELAKDAGVSPAGSGFSGYFADPDGYLWEIACDADIYKKEQENT